MYGIKRIEGRGWSTDHRGRLWIAATAKPPLPQEIEELESFFRTVHALDGGQPGALAFPPAYPTGVLVGCVDVVDCLQASRLPALPTRVQATRASAHSSATASQLPWLTLRPMPLTEQAERAQAWEGLPDSLRAEVGSPFCFLCQNAQRLVVLHPMRGQPKLFRLDGKVLPPPLRTHGSWGDAGPPPTFSSVRLLDKNCGGAPRCHACRSTRLRSWA